MLTPEELNYMMKCQEQWVNRAYTPLTLYNLNKEKQVEVDYMYKGDTLYLKREDLSEAFDIECGYGWQQVFTALKEILETESEFIALYAYICNLLGTVCPGVTELREIWYNPEI